MRIISPLEDLSSVIKTRRVKLAKKQEMIGLILNLVMTILVFVVFIAVITHYLFFRIVQGNNMFPAISDGDLVISYTDDTLVKNDIVFYEVNGQMYLGRIVAKGGDYINITEDGVLYVNGTPQTGEIVFPTYAEDFTPFQLQEGEYYILGDFRTQSVDSRQFGCIPDTAIESKVVCIIRHRKL